MPLKISIFFRPKKSASAHANNVENSAQKNGGDNQRSLAGCEYMPGVLERVLEIRQRAGNDPNIHAKKQSAQAGHEQQKAVVAGLGIFVVHVSHRFAILNRLREIISPQLAPSIPLNRG
jgi:hypothetical protein